VLGIFLSLYQASVRTLVLQVDFVLEAEGQRVDAFMHPTTRKKLVVLCREVLLTAFMRDLLEREGSGMRTLLKDAPTASEGTITGGAGEPSLQMSRSIGPDAMRREKVVSLCAAPACFRFCYVSFLVPQRADIKRMFRLFREVEGGVVLMCNIFRDVVDADGMALVQKRIAKCSAAAEEPVDGAGVENVSKTLPFHTGFSVDAVAAGKAKGVNPYDPEYIDDLLAFWRRYSELIRTEFDDSLDMQTSFRVL
jgi:hypothetical protein